MLKKLHYNIQYQEQTDIIIGSGIVSNLAKIMKPGQYTSYILFLSNATKKLFGDKIEKALLSLGKPVAALVIEGNEEDKNMDTLLRLVIFMKEKNVDKKGVLVAIGGGVVGDIATVAAGLYYRGIDCVLIPTTLLSQVDAAIGGKGAVDMGNHKNTIGITRQPKLIVIDPTLLKTLPKSQKMSGMGEILKYAISMDKELFEILEAKQKLADEDLLPIIERCVKLKMSFVVKDPLDRTGIRQTGNFGHTVGHAIERTAKLSHGEAISIGMIFAIRLSQTVELITESDAKRAIMIIEKYGLPTTVNNVKEADVLNLMREDKKATGGVLRFVLLKRIGEAVTQQEIDAETVQKVLKEVVL